MHTLHRAASTGPGSWLSAPQRRPGRGSQSRGLGRRALGSARQLGGARLGGDATARGSDRAVIVSATGEPRWTGVRRWNLSCGGTMVGGGG